MISTMYSEETSERSSFPSKRHLEDRTENREEHSKRLRPTSFRDQKVTIPQSWLDCPRFGQHIGLIIPSKVPLSESYNDCVPSGKRYNFKQWLTKIGLVIDLTNTTRYYHPNTELRQNRIEYVKIRCSGRDSVPDNVSVNTFVHEVTQFENHNLSEKYLLVHCTHGHNRTGFMIVHYLMRSRPMMSVTQALKIFSDARPPGIYKPDYIDALYRFYHEVKPGSVICPPTPEWKRSEEAKVDDDDNALFYREVQGNNQEENVQLSNDDVLGDEIPYDQEVSYQNSINHMLNISMQFPGSHPLSLGREALQLLRQRYYYATWKADGTRYMMLLTRDGCYLVNREYRFRRVQMRFPCEYEPSDYKVHHYTLLDGEMVVDTIKEGETQRHVRRYLVYDLVAINGQSVAERPFSERWNILERELIKPRNDEKKVRDHWYRYDKEPFGVRIKAFCLLSAVEKKVFNELIPLLSHESDGLIFQGWDNPYVFGPNKDLLKWKFVETLDFLFDMDKYGRQMLFLQERGRMKLMEGFAVEFRGDGWDNDLASYCGKIVECSWDKEKKVWVSLRIRVDKSKPNGIGTGRSVIKCIEDDLTKEVLLKEIKEIILLPMYVERIENDTKEAARRKHGNRKG
ncbi:putative mRNA (guanine-N(7)-)-methyltransferase [Arabidopsis thaliana]